MRNRFRPATLVAMAIGLALLTAACSTGSTDTTSGSPRERAAASPIQVTLKEWAIEPAQIQVPAGQPVKFEVTNDGTMPHSFAFDAGGETYKTGEINGGAQAATLEVPALEAGSYQAYCAVPGHKELGMTAMVLAGQAAGGGSAESGTQGTASGMAESMMGSGMSAEQMAEMHKQGVAAFPAATKGTGNGILKPQMDGNVKVFNLTATEIKWEVSSGVFKDAMAYNGQIPGPQIEVNRGDRVRVVLQNQMTQPTVIHFHGMTVPNRDDGVPYITQDPVMPGEYWTYEFTVRDGPGTYVYHSHFNSTEQVGKGLYGAFVVEPVGPTPWNDEYMLFLGDGPLGYVLNGKGFPATQPLIAKLGDKVLIRIANDGSQLHPMHLHGYHFSVIAEDGIPLKDPSMVDTLVIAPGQRFDVLVDAKYPGVWASLHILPHVEGPAGMYGMVTALVVQK